jgi:membrane-associated phospholipid phosphatase
VITSLRVILLLSLIAVPLQAFQSDDRELGDFPSELGRNFIALFNRSNLLPLALGVGATGGAAAADDDLRRYFGPTRRVKEFGDVGDVLGGPAVVSSAVGALFLTGRFSGDGRFRSMTYSLAQATTLNLGLALGAKAAIRRERPNGENDHSFYSGHSANAFAAATIVGDYYGTKAAIASYAIAALVAGSRLEKNKHNLTDTLAGAAAGYIVARTVSRRDGLRGRLPAIGVTSGPQGGLVFTVVLGNR